MVCGPLCRPSRASLRALWTDNLCAAASGRRSRALERRVLSSGLNTLPTEQPPPRTCQTVSTADSRKALQARCFVRCSGSAARSPVAAFTVLRQTYAADPEPSHAPRCLSVAPVRHSRAVLRGACIHQMRLPSRSAHPSAASSSSRSPSKNLGAQQTSMKD
ncbi:uncharacterized protein M421DRAFT_296418 [Didymella exigua CBS 183.55]|uniref:Uncharacterized protein n=1 Tax=Didymella exigua CBS 183.55 TaxID=1150837 RepID=A0A6A5R7N6_9PLEO|nr:uncharacterized protein M421DRAFT_296418 [Didymella exigua CBS 183.55]KAF1924185.1 hypothetical protein M421DRAFT_296418 [Didymella exigua CBS 183.55]